jgi:hypothetical protein
MATPEPTVPGSAPEPTPDSHFGHDPGEVMHTVPRATRPQIFVVSMLTTLALAAGLIFSAGYANLTLSTRDVGGLVIGRARS